MKRSKEEKKLVVITIIKKINELQLSPEYPAIKELYKLLKEYQENDYSININIKFTEIDRKIIGILPINTKNEPVIKLVNN
jgi:hypothetical protein